MNVAPLIVALSLVFSPQTKSYSLKRTVKATDVASFKIEGTFEYAGQSILFSSTTIDKVASVNPDGSYSVMHSVYDAKIQSQLVSNDVADTSVTIEYNADGSVRKVNGDVSGMSNRVTNLTSFRPPKEAVIMGQTWTSSITANAKTGEVTAKANFKLDGTEKIGKRETLKVVFSVKESNGDPSPSADTTIWLDSTDFTIVRVQSKFRNLPYAGIDSPVSGTLNMERVG